MNTSAIETDARLKQKDTLLLGACCATLVTLVPVTLYQVGVVRQLPDPPLRIFDSERITMSKAAHPLGIPDGFLGIASFGVTLGLVLLARRHAMAKKALGLKLTLDASMAALNAGRQVIQFGKLCSWCTATALSSGVMAYSGRKYMRDSWCVIGDLVTSKFSASKPVPSSNP